MLKNSVLSCLIEATRSKVLPPLGILINSRKCYINFELQNEILILKTNKNMEIINIEARTFEAMAERFKQFAQRVNNLCRPQNKELKKWLDNQEVCMILNISKRTLQTYRDNDTLSFSQINHKMYYKPEDVEQVLNQLKNKPYGK